MPKHDPLELAPGKSPVLPILANPSAPYSIQECSEPQIDPKFVPTIGFRDSNQGTQIFQKIVEESKSCPEIAVPDKFAISTNFGQFGVPAFLNAVRGGRARNPIHQKEGISP